MPNTLLTINMITRKALMILHQKLAFVGTIERQYDDQFAKDGAKIGTSLRIRLPNQYTVGTGSTITPQDTIENSVTLPLATQKNVPMTFLSSELTLSMDDFQERVLDPAMSVLASAVESDAFTMLRDVYQQVGTPGSTPTTLATYLAAKAVLDSALAPASQRRIQLGPVASAGIVNGLSGLFNPQDTISAQYRDGLMGRTAGFDWYMNTLVSGGAITNGNTVAGVTVGTTPLSGATLGLATIASGNTFVKGETFTIANVFSVHPETKVNLGVLQKFAVRTTFSAVATTGVIDITPSLVSTGASQNVNANAVAGAALVFDGTASLTYPVSIAYHKQAFAIAFADLYMPKGLDMASREVLDGISLRIIRDYTVTDDSLVTRVDVLYGYATIRAAIACRIASGVV